MSVYSRLGYNFNTTLFNGADQLAPGVINYLNNTNIQLASWQINDLSNSTVGGYYQNPHQYTLAKLSVYLDAMATLANSNTTIFTNAPDSANTLSNSLSSLASSLISFTIHTNNLSGVTRSSNVALYPDLTSALSVGRQILNITNTTDLVQNNTPILGNFTSLYIGPQLNTSSIVITNDYITLNNSISIVSGNGTSNITNTAMNVIISDVQSLQTLVDGQRSSDWFFYQNSLSVMQDYQTLLQFSNMGATQNSLISLIGTSKLHSELGY
jgi:hypothetical protein